MIPYHFSGRRLSLVKPKELAYNIQNSRHLKNLEMKSVYSRTIELWI